MSESQESRSYFRKLNLLKAGLQSEKFEFIPLKDAGEQEYATFFADRDSRGHTPRQLIDYAAGLEVKDGRMFSFFVREKGRPEYVASLSVMMLPESKTATIGLTVKDGERGRGLGTEITRSVCEGIGRKSKPLGLRQITAEVYPPNEKTERVLQRAGFDCIGTKPTTYTTNTDGSEMEITGKDVTHYEYGLERVRAR